VREKGEGEEGVADFEGVGGGDAVVSGEVACWEAGQVELDLERKGRLGRPSNNVNGGQEG
jgi:hypothetical protein